MFPPEIKQLLTDAENPPISTDSYPHVTIPILLDELQDNGHHVNCTISHKHRTFRWLKPITNNVDNLLQHVSNSQINFNISQILFVCDSKSAKSVLEFDSQVFAVIILSEDEQKVDLNCSPTQYIEIRVQGTQGYIEAISCIQLLFAKMLTWENSLELISLRKGSLTNILDASESIIKNFVFVSDFDFNIIAKTTYMDPPDEFHKDIVERGCLTQECLNEKRVRLPEGIFYEREPSEFTLFYRLSMPIYIDHFHYGSISMACNISPATQGLKDKFKIMCDYMIPICREIWAKQAMTNTPSFFFFEKLIRHESVDEEYLNIQMELAGITNMETFKLILIEIDEEADPATVRQTMKAAAKLNGGNIHCFPYENNTLVLEFASDTDGQLSHIKSIRDLDKWICSPFGFRCAMSTVFFDIRDLDLAYRQAKMALEYQTESSSVLNASPTKSHDKIAEFEAAFPFYLLSSHGSDTRFMHFAFVSSIVKSIDVEDLANGTNHLAILWYYLFSERNATYVAERLHMHRNTVLYNIEKIEKRYDFDLSEKSVRDWVQLCFKYFIMQEGESAMKRLLSPVNKKSHADNHPSEDA